MERVALQRAMAELQYGKTNVNPKFSYHLADMQARLCLLAWSRRSHQQLQRLGAWGVSCDRSTSPMQFEADESNASLHALKQLLDLVISVHTAS